MIQQSESENYIAVSERFLLHAVEQFERGDLPQASEKAWGAVAHYLKSEAKLRSWRNRSHADLSDIATDLAYETDDPKSTLRLFAVAELLHQNFYEDHWGDQRVGHGLEDTHELLSRLKNRSRPPVEPRPSQTGRWNQL